MTTCIPRHTCRHSRTHRPGLTSPGRCRMSFHQARIDASFEASILWRITAEFVTLRTLKNKTPPEGLASRGRSQFTGDRFDRPPSA